MKKTMSLILAVLFVFALFAGCSGGGGSTTTPTQPVTSGTPEATPDATTDPGTTTTPSNPADNLAAGKYDVDENGYPTAPYDYTAPLTTSDEVFTFWTVVWSTAALPEDGYGASPLPVAEHAATGVNIEYVVISQDVRQQNYSVLLAADDLCDISAQATSFHPTTAQQAIEDGYFVNIYDYKEYCPNYIYQVTYNREEDDKSFNTAFYRPDMIAAFYALSKEPFVASNYMARGDWLAELGLTNDDIVTYDDLHEMLVGFKTTIGTCEFPWPLLNTLDITNNATFLAFDTIPYVGPYVVGPMFVVDGQVRSPHVNDGDRQFMTLLNQWYSEGLIHPDWASFDNNTKFTDLITTDQVGYAYMSPGEVDGYETQSSDPDAQWVPIHRPLLEEGQVIHVGGQMTRIGYGSASISANCSNIPLIVSWCDWRYSPSGSDLSSWGEEGVLWEYDESGNRIATDFALNNPYGLSFAWCCMFYGMNSLAEHGMEDTDRKYALEGGERMLAMHDYWADWDYDGAYDLPAGVKLTQEQTEVVNDYSSDVITFLSENYLAFVDNSKPLSEWDSYVSGLLDLGLSEIIAVYQQAYDDYMATQTA